MSVMVFLRLVKKARNLSTLGSGMLELKVVVAAALGQIGANFPANEGVIWSYM